MNENWGHGWTQGRPFPERRKKDQWSRAKKLRYDRRLGTKAKYLRRYALIGMTGRDRATVG